MHAVDLGILVLYLVGLLAFGTFFFRKNQTTEEYYVGGRGMSSLHVGLSVVATDVGGGFSIGLGGLGFLVGLSGSWMLFTGLAGAWLAAVFLIPKIKNNPFFDRALTFPQLFAHYYGPNAALLAAAISAIGYIGFTSSQILAGAKLASGTFPAVSMEHALWVMGGIAILYTVLGGIKAVIYTDTVQWALLMGGLVFIGLPLAYREIGGIEAIRATLPPEMLSFGNLAWQEVLYWAVTIIPIWFVGMTLYQRIYACRDEKTARRAWYIAGLFEWPVMAFMGVLLGLFARVAAEQGMFAYLGAPDAAGMDPETGLPMLLRSVLPVGLLGLMMASYFSAVLSTADSCLMAASGNLVSDILPRLRSRSKPAAPASSAPDSAPASAPDSAPASDPDSDFAPAPSHASDSDASFLREIRLSQIGTLALGLLALVLASSMTRVLDLMLASYAFMVSGLFVPVIGALYWRRSTSTAAITAMLSGGTITLALTYATAELPLPFGLDPSLFGITASAALFIVVSLAARRPDSTAPTPDSSP